MPKRNTSKEKPAFDKWFLENYSRLKEMVSLKSILDEDAFHEAYLVIVTDKSMSASSKDFRKIFLTAYKAITKRSLSENYRVCFPDELFFAMLPTPEIEDEPKIDTTALASEIRSYIHNTFTAVQKSIFTMRVQGYSIRETADTFGINNDQVKDEVRNITCRTRERFAYAI